MDILGRSPKLWRAQAQLVGMHANAACVRIPAMARGHDEHNVPLDVVPADTPIGGRFHLRCTLDHERFVVEPDETVPHA